VADPESSEAEYLARAAYRTYREWTEPEEQLRVRHFDQLDAPTRRAWLEVAIVLWNEIHTNTRPPVAPSQRPHRRRFGKVSAFTLLKDDPKKDSKT
jgi:hypothetical protein